MEKNIYELIERMAALIRSEERKKCTELGIQTVHFQVLDYLSRCNKYSDAPASVALYLGMTRGTVSQSLMILEKKGMIKKAADSADKRKVHVSLLPVGIDMLEKAKPTTLFTDATVDLERSYPELINEEVFVMALTALQKANRSQSFGMCATCKNFTRTERGFYCQLTKEVLTQSDSEKICQEHQVL
ncbi:MAG: winged helix-turn-helix transcriptional regulator [Methyloprofundus sp.]|nr:winged helix-turn-helix transcriptional regulator [Methyloprofundus sp.]MBW6452176.1 MarR family winged helix-turn-helix transcriptional regulator [Methyloprofundus sp.]